MNSSNYARAVSKLARFVVAFSFLSQELLHCGRKVHGDPLLLWSKQQVLAAFNFVLIPVDALQTLMLPLSTAHVSSLPSSLFVQT